MPDPIRPTHKTPSVPCRAVVIWIDWYAYHLARFRGLQEAFGTHGEVVGLELVDGAGVHAGMHFREDRPADLPIRTLMPGQSWKNASQQRLARLVWQHLDELDPELVLVPGYYTLPALAAALWARHRGRTAVLMTESTAADHPRHRWQEKFKSLLLRGLFPWAVCGGQAHLQYLRQLSFPMDHVAHFYNVVGNDEIAEGTDKLRETADRSTFGLPERYFLYVGRLAPEKNVRGLWSAWLRYRAAGGTWGLVFAGDGPEMPALQEAVRNAARAASDAGARRHRHCCEDVVFAGHKDAGGLLPLYAFASCFVLPSTREPWGLVVNEAMAAGLPVIVSSHCGCARTLVGPLNGETPGPLQNGVIFDPDKEEQLVGCLRRIASMPDDAREGMGRASRERIADYSPRNFGLEIESIARRAGRGSTAHGATPQRGSAW